MLGVLIARELYGFSFLGLQTTHRHLHLWQAAQPKGGMERNHPANQSRCGAADCTQPAKKRGLPTPKVMNSLTPLLEPASEKAQGGKCPLAPPEMSILILWQSEYG